VAWVNFRTGLVGGVIFFSSFDSLVEI
jgi:hypothetical protein